jgi:predicted kinase
MDNIIITVAGIMPIDAIVDMMEMAIKEYKEDKSDDTLHILNSISAMLVAKIAIDKHGFEKIDKRMDDINKIKNLLEQSDN